MFLGLRPRTRLRRAKPGLLARAPLGKLRLHGAERSGTEFVAPPDVLVALEVAPGNPEQADVNFGLHFLELGLALRQRLAQLPGQALEKAFALAKPHVTGYDVFVELRLEVRRVVQGVSLENCNLAESPVLLGRPVAHEARYINTWRVWICEFRLAQRVT